MVQYLESIDLDNTTLIYVHDPMCSWCWGFRPALTKLFEALPENLNLLRIVGGLAPDSDHPMPDEMKSHLASIWRTIQRHIPGTNFNFDFWTDCQPRRSTYPACRGVIAARLQGIENDDAMTHAIQKAYYLEARNPSDNSTLIEIAEEIGLDKSKFEDDLVSEEVHVKLCQEINLSRQLGVQGFPGLAIVSNKNVTRIPVDYNNCEQMQRQIISVIGNSI